MPYITKRKMSGNERMLPNYFYITDINSGGELAMNIETIRHEALLLPLQERAQLAEQLLSSLIH
ncbi:MAG: hypothetical protein QX198_15410 [Methylococcaceae bacterium]